MLIRFVVNNVYSFGESKEFNMLSRPKTRTLPNHKYSNNSLDFLKLAAIYGANGAGKSNLVKALALLQSMVIDDVPTSHTWGARFKFVQKNQKQVLAVEFIQDETPFYYAIEIEKGLISAEELYISGLGKTKDKLVFERKTQPDGSTILTFLEEFEKDAKGQMLKSILLEEFVKPGKTMLKFLANRDNIHLKIVKKAYKWFEDTLQIISPDTKPLAFVHHLEGDPGFKEYAEDTMRSLNLGINALILEKENINDVFKNDKDNEEAIAEIRNKLADGKGGILGFRNPDGNELLFVKEGDEIIMKTLKLQHLGKDGQKAMFEINEESDGTIRLLDFVPAFRDIVLNKKVYVIDEIERSLHPILIKELVSKFSHDAKSKGQLIITTHESNLLDQSIFRQDEIWFVEKKESGETDLYSLSDFKEHNTIDIRKGYLNGRYGSVPFLANLQELNWHGYDTH